MLDPSILLKTRGVQLEDPYERQQRAMTLSSLADAQRLRQMQMDERERGLKESDALRRVLGGLQQGGYSDESIAAAIQSAPEAGPAIVKAAQEARKARAEERYKLAETDSKRVGTAGERYKLFGGIAGELADNPTAQAWQTAKRNAATLGIDPSVLDVPDGVDPRQHFASLAQQSLSRAQQMEIRDRGLVRAETGRHNLATEENTVRGQDMTDARGREFNATQTELARARMAQAAATRAQANATGAGNVDKLTRETEMKLADDYRTQSKGFQEVSGSLKKINAALDSATTNAGSALAAGTAFMKLLDPNSVVRESELGMALNASGWMDRARNVFQVMQSGKVMTPLQVKNLRESAQALFAEAAATQRQIDAGYTKRAKDYGANPDRVIMDFGQVEKPQGPAAPQLGARVDGYIYKGGDPAKQSSWEKAR